MNTNTCSSTAQRFYETKHKILFVMKSEKWNRDVIYQCTIRGDMSVEKTTYNFVYDLQSFNFHTRLAWIVKHSDVKY